MDEPADAGCRTAFHKVAGGVHVNAAVLRVRYPGPTEYRGQMVHGVYPVQRLLDDRPVPDVACDELDPAMARLLGVRRAASQRPDAVAAGEEMASQSKTGIAGRTGDEDLRLQPPVRRVGQD